MSERGSFVTDYIYCPECLKAMESVLVRSGKYLTGRRIESWQVGEFLPIIAGKIGGMYGGEEIVEMTYELFTPDNAPCHPVRMAVLSDTGGAAVLKVCPDGSVEEMCRIAAGSPLEVKHD